MIAERQESHEPDDRPLDPDFDGALAALKRAATKARRRAIETSGYVAVLRDGKVVWDDTLPELETEDAEGV